MKKFLVFFCIPLLFLVGGCGNNADEDFSSQIKLEIKHITSTESNKEINISYPVVGGLADSQTLSSINNSIYNYVEIQENEFNNALSEITNTKPIAHNFDATVKKQIVAPKTNKNKNTDATDENNTDESSNTSNSDDAENTTDEDSNTDDAENTTDEDSNTDDAQNTTDEEQSTDNANSSVTVGTNPISLDMTFNIVYHDNNIMNIMESYKKVLGEGKTYMGQQSFVFDLAKGVPITIGDIYDFKSDFPSYINKAIKEQIKASPQMELYSDKAGFTGIRKDANFYLEESNGKIVIFYNALEISPEKTLIPSFKFSLKELSPYLLETYAKKLNK